MKGVSFVLYNDIIEVFDSIERTDVGKNHVQPTLLYNEGWMLRLVLTWFAKNVDIDYKISMKNNAHWFSEALLSSKFRPLFRGDNLSESYTHADGAYGDIIIGDKGFGDLSLKDNCRQFVVLEAKMFSKLSKGTKNAPDYNQAARNIACMCNIVANSKQNIDDLGFSVIVPAEQMKSETMFSEYTDIGHVKQTVFARINQYSNRKDHEEKALWYDVHFLPFCESIKINLISWEEIINFIIQTDGEYGNKLSEFYEKCLLYNKSVRG
jgi:hypothetical protein